MKKIIQSFFKESEIRKNFFTLIIGTTIAQVVPFILSPILTRLFTSADFGTYAQFTSLTGMIGVIATGRYELAIVLPKKDKNALSLFVLCLFWALAMSLLSLISIVIFHSSIILFFKNPNISLWLYLVPLSILFMGINQSLNYWFNRKKEYKSLSLNKITRNLGISLSSISIGYTKIISGGLILGQIIGDGLVSCIYGFQFLRKNKLSKSLISRQRIFRQAKIYKEFPLINSFQAFADQMKDSGIIFILTGFFSNTILGLYSFGYRTISIPLALISYSASQIFYQNTSSLKADFKPITPFLMSTVRKLFIFSLIFFPIVFFFIDDCFALIFGPTWREAGAYVKILAPFLVLNFIVSPVSMLPLILLKQRQNFIFSLYNNGSLLLTLFLCGYFSRRISYTLAGFSIIASINLLVILFWYFKISKKHDEGLNNINCFI